MISNRNPRLWAVLLAVLAVLPFLPSTPAARAQQVAGSVEIGLQSLAQDIVGKSAAADRDVIAVLPFPNADGTCSVLSTYLADELIQSLFSVPNSPLKIIERSQLEALIREIQIGEGGLLNPETTQKLGSVSGVKALTVGTITEIGDRVRINARLVATDSGRTISAAAVTVPRTSDLDGLLRRPIPGANGVCGATESPSQQRSASTTAGTASPAPMRQGAVTTATLEGLTFTVQRVARSTSSKQISLTLSILDTKQAPVRAIFVSPAPTLIDDQGSMSKAVSLTGVVQCTNSEKPFDADPVGCLRNSNRDYWTILSPGLPATVLIRFETEQGISGSNMAFSSEILIEDMGESEKAVGRHTSRVSLSLSNLTIGGVR